MPSSYALLSVSDKTGLVPLATFLSGAGVTLVSTGGTAAAIRAAGLPCEDVSALTGHPEVLGGRVKSLHPKIHGAILRRRGEPSDDAECEELSIPSIDYVVCNLYPFEEAVARGGSVAECVENVDIGGPSMIRSAAKNHAHVCVLTNPGQYQPLIDEIGARGAVSAATRRRLAAAAFRRTAEYDANISAWAERALVGSDDGGDGEGCDEAEKAGVVINNTAPDSATESRAIAAITAQRPVMRVYTPLVQLKYGVNPHQQPAALCGIDGAPLPFTVVNGAIGAINVMDALNAYQLVRDLARLTGRRAAASFKHLSPAGAAVASEGGAPLSDDLRRLYEVDHLPFPITGAAEAYVRARGADPKSSFGDFVAVSGTVDAPMAAVLRMEVSDGIVADGYEPEALEVLRAKKGGKFVVLQMAGWCAEHSGTEGAGAMEFREIMGVGFAQLRNDRSGAGDIGAPVTNTGAGGGGIPAASLVDLQVALVTLKYTQSNSIGMARDGQMVAVAAGQQSRIDCTRLAAAKARTWALRQHPRVTGIAFRDGVKRQERINARVAFIEGEFGQRETQLLREGDQPPAPLTDREKEEFLASEDGPLRGLCLASDAFFPFRDNIDFAASQGVKYIAQPGGSTRDDDVIAACNEHGIAMVFNGGTRLFHH